MANISHLSFISFLSADMKTFPCLWCLDCVSIGMVGLKSLFHLLLLPSKKSGLQSSNTRCSFPKSREHRTSITQRDMSSIDHQSISQSLLEWVDHVKPKDSFITAVDQDKNIDADSEISSLWLHVHSGAQTAALMWLDSWSSWNYCHIDWNFGYFYFILYLHYLWLFTLPSPS